MVEELGRFLMKIEDWIHLESAMDRSAGGDWMKKMKVMQKAGEKRKSAYDWDEFGRWLGRADQKEAEIKRKAATMVPRGGI